MTNDASSLFAAAGNHEVVLNHVLFFFAKLWLCVCLMQWGFWTKECLAVLCCLLALQPGD